MATSGDVPMAIDTATGLRRSPERASIRLRRRWLPGTSGSCPGAGPTPQASRTTAPDRSRRSSRTVWPSSPAAVVASRRSMSGPAQSGGGRRSAPRADQLSPRPDLGSRPRVHPQRGRRADRAGRRGRPRRVVPDHQRLECRVHSGRGGRQRLLVGRHHRDPVGGRRGDRSAALATAPPGRQRVHLASAAADRRVAAGPGVRDGSSLRARPGHGRGGVAPDRPPALPGRRSCARPRVRRRGWRSGRPRPQERRAAVAGPWTDLGRRVRGVPRRVGRLRGDQQRLRGGPVRNGLPHRESRLHPARRRAEVLCPGGRRWSAVRLARVAAGSPERSHRPSARQLPRQLPSRRLRSPGCPRGRFSRGGCGRASSARGRRSATRPGCRRPRPPLGCGPRSTQKADRRW